MAAKPTPKPKPKAKSVEDILKQNQKTISPKGVTAAEAAAKKALEEKYPGMFIPSVRRTAGINRGN